MSNANQELWEKGDFTRIAALMRPSGQAFVASLGLNANQEPPLRVLDLGCGDGTTAVPLAQMGADVTGIDISRPLVAAGRARARAAGLGNLSFQEGDACDLAGVADGSFDLSLSMFGAMFAPRPFDVAREMVRVTRKGGRVVMANWIPNDPESFVSQVLKVSAAYTPPPPEGFVSPMLWGVQSNIVERFGQAGIAADRIHVQKDVFVFGSKDTTPAAFIDIFREFYGPTMNAYAAAAKDGKAEELHTKLLALAAEQNQSDDGTLRMGATYARVMVEV